MNEIRNSTMLRRRLGARLRGFREERRMTIDQVGELIGVSRPTLSRVETGNGVTRKLVLDALLRLYDVEEIEAKELVAMADAAREPSWWEAYRDTMPHRFDIYVGLESAAEQLRGYDVQCVDGLLQTPDYARALLRVGMPESTDAEVERLVELRMARKRTLDGAEALRAWVILEESVLHRPVGGGATQRAQLEHLLASVRRPNITVQVLPAARGAHPGLDGPFTLLSFADHSDLAYVESQAGNTYVEDKASVSRITLRFEHLRAAALDLDSSADAIADAARSCEG